MVRRRKRRLASKAWRLSKAELERERVVRALAGGPSEVVRDEQVKLERRRLKLAATGPQPALTASEWQTLQRPLIADGFDGPRTRLLRELLRRLGLLALAIVHGDLPGWSAVHWNG
jgi:hypothetical protein